MKSTIVKKILTFGILSVVLASLLYADDLIGPPAPPELNTTQELELPPETPEVNATEELETPPDYPVLDDNVTAPDDNTTTPDDQFISCDYGQYFNPLMESCTTIKPITLSELTTGIWLDVVVDKDANPPVATSDISGCTTIINSGMYLGDLNITSISKNENNVTETENSSYASYDENSGMLNISFYNPDDMNHDTTGGMPATGGESEMVYITREVIDGKSYTFIIREEYMDGQSNMFIDGLIENNTTAQCSAFESQLVFENDYFNPNLDKPIQFSGNVILPDDIDPNSVHMSAMKENWNFVSSSNLDKVNNNAFTLGFDNGGEYAIQANINTPEQWFEFYYTPTNGWVQADWSKPLEDYMFLIDSNMTNVDLNLTAIFASQVRANGTVTFNDSDNVQIEFIDMQTGYYFGWNNLDVSGDFSTVLQNANPGSKYVMKLNKNSDDYTKWESYFVSLNTDGSVKLVPDTNIEWNGYNLVNGELQEVEDGSYNYSVWLPDFEKTGYITVPDNSQVPDINITLTDEALEAQFFIIDGNVTLPNDFDGNVHFEALDKDSGQSLSWTELDKDSTPNTFRIQLDNPADVIVRINYEENSGGAYNYRSYYLKGDGTLVSDRDIQYTPILKDWDGNDLVVLNKTSDQCMDDNNFWYQEPGTMNDMNFDQGICYNDYPSNWIPNPEQTGSISLTDTNKKQSFNLDFAALEANAYKLEGFVVLPEGFAPNYSSDWSLRKAIMIEVIDAKTGMWLGNTNISENAVEPNTYAYSLKLDGVDENSSIIVKLIKEDNTATDGKTWESYYLEFDTSGNVVGIKTEESVQWKESENEDDDGYSYYIPDVDALDLNETTTITLNLNYETILGSYESNRLAIKGQITLLDEISLGSTDNYYWNNVRVEVINTNNGDWIGSKDAQCVNGTNSCTNLGFDIDIPAEGNYSIKVIKEVDGIWEEYYYNFGADHDVNGTTVENADKLVNGQNIQWVEAEDFPSWGGNYKNWLPDPSKTGYVTMTSGQKELIIDFNAFAASRLSFGGTVELAYDFVPGEYCTNGTTEVKRCDWTKPENIGFNNWIGSKYVRVEIIDKNTGEYVGSTELKQPLPNTNLYEFKLDLGDTPSSGTKDFIVKIIKESSKDGNWKFDEIFYNFGVNNTFDTIGSDDSLVNGKKVMYKYATQLNEWGYYSWMPDATQTGFVAMDSSIENFTADISEFGASDKKISGIVKFKSDFDITSNKTFASVSAIDATTGMQVGDSSVEDDGSFKINVGEDVGKYILQVNYSYNDYTNWQNSWHKNKYYDFGSDNANGGNDDQLLNDMDVRWVPVLGTALTITNESSCWRGGNYWDYEAVNGTQACYAQPQYWVPNVNPLDVQNDVADINIDLSAAVGNTLNISITNLPSNAKDPYVYITDPKNYNGIWQNLIDGNITISELKDGNYTIEFGYSIDGTWEYKHFFIKDGVNGDTLGLPAVSATPGNDVRWQEIDSSTHMWGPNPADTTYVNIDTNTDIVISIPVVIERKVDITLGNLTTNSNVDVEFKSTNKPYARWEQLNSNNDTNVSTSFTDVKDGDYILSFWYDGNQYTCDGATCSTLKKDVEWVVKNIDGATVWMPDVTPINIDSNETISVDVPSLPTVTATVNLGADFANERVDFNIWQYNGNSWNWKQVDLNSTGGANISMKVAEGSNYIIELWTNGLGGYTYTTDKNLDGTIGDSGWIASYNTWTDSGSGMWAPRASVLTTVGLGGLALGDVSIGSEYQKVTITVQNLDKDGDLVVEDVWVSLEGTGSEGYYGEGNANWEVYPATYDENITLKVPNGTYKMMVFPMNHKGGYASNGDSTENESLTAFTKLGWSHYDNVVVSDSALNVTVTLPLAVDLRAISGTVTTGSSDNSGWIEAWSETLGIGKGTIVDTNGSFEIKGLGSASDYELTFYSFNPALNDLTLVTSGVDVSSGNVVDATVQKSLSTTIESITGTVSNVGNNDNIDYYVALVEYDGVTQKNVANAIPDENGDFSFGTRPKPTNKSLTVVVVGRTFTNGTSSITYGDTAVEVYDQNGNIDSIPLGNLSVTYSLNAQINDVVGE